MNIVRKILRRLGYGLLRHIKPVMVGGYRNASGTFLHHTRISTSTFIDHPENLEIEDYVFIGHHNYIEASEGLTIEEGCQITNFVSITTHSSHNSIRLYGREYVSHSRHKGYVRGSVFIGRFSFIGPHSLIMPGTRIGMGSIVSAYSHVQGEFPDFSILKGNPAIVVGDTRQKDLAVINDHPELKSYYSAWAGNQPSS
jgi:acetyltransferase-like isoleucine patch superfamily enzyme